MELMDWIGIILVMLVCLSGWVYFTNSRAENNNMIELNNKISEWQTEGHNECKKKSMEFVAIGIEKDFVAKVVCETKSPVKKYYFRLSRWE